MRGDGILVRQASCSHLQVVKCYFTSLLKLLPTDLACTRRVFPSDRKFPFGSYLLRDSFSSYHKHLKTVKGRTSESTLLRPLSILARCRLMLTSAVCRSPKPNILSTKPNGLTSLLPSCHLNYFSRSIADCHSAYCHFEQQYESKESDKAYSRTVTSGSYEHDSPRSHLVPR